ncbi:hypothetical protein EW146_g5284 [Bondarzewia mesenterica]|uniref:Dipeptidase n=1 Tax=Bondarzewia mesenterica TaxID=1095465 RepID=A0A4S4LTU7_9AGAM|nr:hypothetical protein EW146_g5284 [Bondarzewia mesenterica]
MTTQIPPFSSDRVPLLNTNGVPRKPPTSRVRSLVHGALTVIFVLTLIPMLFFLEDIQNNTLGQRSEWAWLSGRLPRDPALAARKILERAPVIDGHIDLPWLVRAMYANNASAVDLESRMPGHVDIPRLRSGGVGGFFWSVYTPCPKDVGYDAGEDFVNSTWSVRDTLEQIDVANLLIDKYPDAFDRSLTAADIKSAISRGKIASLLGVEGAHQLGNSIGVLRQYYTLGVRYVTLTHTCHNAFADSCGLFEGIAPRHNGLSNLGRTLIVEMNRLGMLVDLSHTSDETALQALDASRAPVIWSHSSARALRDIPRNVPDRVLERVAERDGVVMVNFYPAFVHESGEADVKDVADHVEHIARVAGKKHVGIGSDFDGIGSVPEGLEDVSKYPALIAELYTRGWDKFELAGLAGANLLRVMEGAERVKEEMRREGVSPVADLYDKRPDLPMQGRL